MTTNTTAGPRAARAGSPCSRSTTTSRGGCPARLSPRRRRSPSRGRSGSTPASGAPSRPRRRTASGISATWCWTASSRGRSRSSSAPRPSCSGAATSSSRGSPTAPSPSPQAPGGGASSRARAPGLLGRGALLTPGEPARTEPFAAGSRWEVLEPSRVAVLDRRFTAILSRWPEITAAVVGRAVSRSRALALTLAISQLVGVELRVLALLWHIAERWGAHDGDGTVLPVHLTHQLLASLISAQRATVTRALSSLGEQGLLSRRDDGLVVLHGDPPVRFRRTAAGG